MSEKIDIEKKKLIGRDSPLMRCSYPALDKPKAFEDNDPEYSVTGLIPKTDKKGLALLQALHEAAMTEKFGPRAKWTAKQKANYHSPFRDGDEEKPDQEAYKGMIFVRFKAKEDKPPQVFTRQGDTVYAGCWIKVSAIAYAYEYMGKIGGGFALKGVQKVKDDKKLGNSDVSDQFDAVDDGGDAPENFETPADRAGDDGDF
jgi:hypothetical protein